MVNEFDNKGVDENELAESLYKKYQRQRSSTKSQPGDGTSENAIERSVVSGDVTSGVSAAEHVYQTYQESRKDNNEQAIDRIIQTINRHTLFADETVPRQSLNAAPQREHQSRPRPEAQQAKTRIQSINATPGQVFDDAVQDMPAANHARRFKRLLLPAIAAAVLGIALVPAIVNQSSEPETRQALVPELLLEHAQKSVVFLHPPASSGFGFTNTDNPQNTAFRYGVVMTELELFIRSGAAVDAIPYARQIVSISPPQNGVEGGQDPGNAALSLITALNVDADKDQLEENLDTFRNAIEYEVRTAKQMDWYSTGQWVESIRIAARYSLDEDDFTALQQALNLAGEVNFPQDIPSIAPLLDRLAKIRLTPPDEYEQVSQIIDVAENIKVLMQ